MFPAALPKGDKPASTGSKGAGRNSKRDTIGVIKDGEDGLAHTIQKLQKDSNHRMAEFEKLKVRFCFAHSVPSSVHNDGRCTLLLTGSHCLQNSLLSVKTERDALRLEVGELKTQSSEQSEVRWPPASVFYAQGLCKQGLVGRQ